MRRVPYALAALTALLVAAPSHATPCPILTDPTGDGHTPAISPVPPALHPTVAAAINSPAIDIVSADLASGATEVAVELRVDDLTQDVMSTFNVQWFVGFRVGTTRYAVSASRGLNGTTYDGAFRASGLPDVAIPVAVDLTTSSFRWEFPRSYIPEIATPGATFHTIAATTGWFVSNADAVTTTDTYVDQDPGCITAS